MWKRCSVFSPGKCKERILEPKVSIDDPLAATREAERGARRSAEEAGKTETSAPVSTKKCLLEDKSFKDRDVGEDAEVRWLIEVLPGVIDPRRERFPNVETSSSICASSYRFRGTRN